MTILDLRPARLDIRVRPGDDHYVVLTWPDSLAGRTFEATLMATELAVEIDGNRMTIAIPDDVTSAIDPGAVWTLQQDVRCLNHGHVDVDPELIGSHQ